MKTLNSFSALAGQALTRARRLSTRLLAALLLTAGVSAPALAQTVSFTGASPASYSGAGQVITFSLTYSGSNATTNTITFPNAGMNYPASNVSCPGLPAAPFATINCTFQYTTTASDTFGIQEFGSWRSTDQNGTPRSGNISNQQAVPFVPAVTPSVSIAVSPASILEDAAGTMNYTITLSAAAATDISVNLTTSGTATTLVDYTGATNALTIPAGVTTGVVTIDPTADATVEPNETVIMTVAAGTGYTVGAPASATGTITNDDAITASIAVAPASVSEDGATNLIYTVTLSQASASATSVNFAVSGTATSGTDFAAVTSPLVIAAGATTGTITVNPTGDATIEANETVILTLAAGAGYTVGAPASATGTILNDDVPSASITVAPASVSEDGAANLIYTVTLNQAAFSATSVNFVTSGTASSGSDYAAVTSPLVIAAGATTGTITINPTVDANIEADETAILTLTAGAGYTVGAPSAATGTILNDDLPSISISNASAFKAEGNLGVTSFDFLIQLNSPAPPGGVSFTLATADGSATASSGDYVARNETVTIPAGATDYTATIAVNGDTLNESNESFRIDLSNPVNATLTDTTASGSIVNDDAVPNLSINNATVVEGNAGTVNAVFTATLDAASGQLAVVTYSTVNGTAVAPGDFIAQTSQLIFAPGETVKTISVPVVGDTTPEANETFTIALSAPVNLAIVAGGGLGTITNDDVPVTVSPATVPNAQVGVAYSSTIVAAGGTAPYSFAITAGALPAGLSLSPGGSLSGTPTAGGVFNFTVRATDSSGSPGPYTGARAYSLTVSPATITLPATALAGGTLGTAYSAALNPAAGGTAPYSYAITAGALPGGLSLNAATGTVTGTPSALGSFNFTVTATDSSTGTGPYSGARAFALTITDVTPVANAVSATVAFNSSANPIPLSLSGGAATSVAVASAASHGTATASGTTIAYTPTAGYAGPDSFTYTATNSGGTSAPATVTITVSAPTITVTVSAGFGTTLGVPYTQTITWSGGTAPYSGYSVSNLPAGLSITGTTANSVTFSGTPTAAGAYTLNVSATDSSTGLGPFTEVQLFTLTASAPILTLAPANATFTTAYAAAYSQSFTAAGGIGPYTYSLSGALPAGVTFSGNTLSGTPTAPGSFPITVTATDTGSTGSGAPFTVTNNYTLAVTAPTVAVNPTTLPNTSAGVAYSQTVTATGAVAPYNFTTTAGALPTGLTLTTAGAITGTPTSVGTFNFTVQASDANGQTGARAYTVVIAAPVLTLTPASGTLTAPYAVAYSQTFTASGGVGPYAYAIATPPAGLTLSGNTLSGTPTVPGSYSFTVVATDIGSIGAGAPFTIVNTYTLVVTAPTIVLTPATLPDSPAFVPYAQTVSASGGVGPYTYTIESFQLPTGLSLAADGQITGTPTQVGPFSFALRATDANGQFGIQAYTVGITRPILTLTPATVPAGTAGSAYSQIFTSSGGTAAYSYTLSAGALPAGLTLSSTGTLAGTPSASGTFNFSVTVTDSTPGIAGRTTAAYALVISVPTLTLSPATLAAGEQQLAYSQTFSAAGGVAPYAYTLASGVLPPGLALNGTSGVLSGTPTANGTYTFDITATDSTSGTPATVTRPFTLVITLRPDPSKDAEVLGLLDAQAASTRRFAEAQIGNFRQHLERLHDGSGAQSRGGGSNLSFSATNSFDPHRDCLQPTVVDNTLDCSQAPRNNLAANAGDTGAGNTGSGGNNNSPVNLWVGGVIRNGDRDATNGRSGFDFETDGVSVGADYRVNSSFVIGGGFGIGHDTTDVGTNGSQLKGDAKTAVIYGSYHPGSRFYVDGLIGRQTLSYDLRRYVAATGGQVVGNRDGDQWLASLAIGADIRRDAFQLSPYVRWDYASANLDGYTERGDAVWALRYADQKLGTSTVNLGLRVQNRYETRWGAFSPQFRLEYQHDLRSNEEALISYADILSGPVYRAVILGAQKNRIELGLGGAFELQRQWALRLEYRIQRSDIDASSAVQLNVEKSF